MKINKKHILFFEANRGTRAQARDPPLNTQFRIRAECLNTSLPLSTLLHAVDTV